MRSITLSWLEAAVCGPPAQLRLDEELLLEGNGVLRLWETTDECVVLGQAGLPQRDVQIAECYRADVPILRRSSGGGAVLLGLGCLNYSLILPLEWEPKWHEVRYSLTWVMSRMRQALALPGLQCEGDCDLAMNRRKVSGSAQRRTRHAILHHGTLLYDFDPTRAQRFLKPPHREPRYRAGRTHIDFLGNLPLTSLQIRQRLMEAWC